MSKTYEAPHCTTSSILLLFHPSFVPSCERPSFTPIQNNWQNYGFAYVNLYIHRQQAGRHKTLGRMVANIPRI
jgi:hypothetical protein